MSRIGKFFDSLTRGEAWMLILVFLAVFWLLFLWSLTIVL